MNQFTIVDFNVFWRTQNRNFKPLAVYLKITLVTLAVLNFAAVWNLAKAGLVSSSLNGCVLLPFTPAAGAAIAIAFLLGTVLTAAQL